MITIFVCLIIVMLLMIAAGAVTYCVHVHRECRRIEVSAQNALNAAFRAKEDINALTDEIEVLRAEAKPEQPPDSKTEAINKQYDELQGYVLPENYGLHFEGVSKHEN